MSLSGTDPDYPSVDEARGAGVFHVGCLHVLSLAPEERDRFIGKLQGKDGEAARQAEIGLLLAASRPAAKELLAFVKATFNIGFDFIGKLSKAGPLFWRSRTKLAKNSGEMPAFAAQIGDAKSFQGCAVSGLLQRI